MDHADRNPLNNQKSNLRLCTKAQNNANKSYIKRKEIPFKGVVWNKRSNKFYSFIKYQSKTQYLGSFETPEQSAYVYNIFAKEYFKEFAYLNKCTVSEEELKYIINYLEKRKNNINKQNKTGVSGMRQYGKHSNRYLANIKYKGISNHLGVFDSAEECKNVIAAFKNSLIV